jgi:hypothetical protein
MCRRIDEPLATSLKKNIAVCNMLSYEYDDTTMIKYRVAEYW